MSSVNAAAIAPARQFLFCNLVVRHGALLTPDLGFARQAQAQGNERTAVPTTATNEKRFGKLPLSRSRSDFC